MLSCFTVSSSAHNSPQNSQLPSVLPAPPLNLIVPLRSHSPPLIAQCSSVHVVNLSLHSIPHLVLIWYSLGTHIPQLALTVAQDLTVLLVLTVHLSSQNTPQDTQCPWVHTVSLSAYRALQYLQCLSVITVLHRTHSAPQYTQCSLILTVPLCIHSAP